MVVILYSIVISAISLSITMAVIGSNPEFGSSQNKYFGFKAIALAMATLFFIPPLSSAGYSLLTFSRCTLSKQKLVRSNFSS